MLKITDEQYQIFSDTNNPRLALQDYLESCILEKLFQNDYFRRNFIFTGGATLLKSYQIGGRIGKDIDLALINFTDIPQNRTKRQLSRFKNQFKTFTFSNIYSRVNSIINTDKKFDIITDHDWPSPEDDERHASSPALHLLYQSEFGDGHLCLEISARKYNKSQIVFQTITPYSTGRPLTTIPTVSYQQTFWDKIFALHSNATSKKPHTDKSYARHYYDVSILADKTDIDKTYHLLSKTIAYQMVHTTRIIQPLNATDIILLPDDKTLYQLSDDYYAMSGTFIKPQTSWNDIVQRLQTLNQEIKTLTSKGK